MSLSWKWSWECRAYEDRNGGGCLGGLFKELLVERGRGEERGEESREEREERRGGERRGEERERRGE